MATIESYTDIEQKPTWSEEDEARFESCIKVLQTSDGYDTINAKWLISLKDRVQSQNTWKPSKEQIMALRWVLNNVPYNKYKEEISGLLDQIKDL